MTNSQEIPIFRALGEFTVHIVVGALAFLVLFAAAAFLSLCVTYLENLGINPILIKGMTGAEYFLFGVDFLLGSVFVLISTAKLIGALWRR